MDRTVLIAVATLALGMTLIPLGDTFGKAMTSSGIDPIYVGWSRFALGALLLLPVTGLAAVVRVSRDWRLWLRSALLVGGIYSILNALSLAPMANVFGAFFVGPMVSYALSVWFLKEPVYWPRTVLLAVGFCGVMLVVKPGWDLSAGMIWAMCAGTFYGAFLTVSRWLAGVARPVDLLVTSLTLAALITFPLGLTHLPPITVGVAGLTFGSAVASMLGNLLLLKAYAQAPASILAPFVYTQLLAATMLGWFVFGDWPDWVSLTGLGLIIASGLATLALRSTPLVPGSRWKTRR